MGIRMALFTLLFTAGSCAVALESQQSITNEEKYAVSYCLAGAYPDSAFSNDARYILGAYLEMGEVGINVYQSIAAFVDEYKKKPYVSKNDRNLNIMQCLDLFGSEELAAVIRESANSTEQDY